MHFRLQCQGMPSFTKQGQGFADTASVKGWALQAPAELNLAGSFMRQQIKQWQQRWSPAAHRTSASMGTRPLSCFGLFWLVPASCSAWCLGGDSQHIEEQSQASRAISKHDLTGPPSQRRPTQNDRNVAAVVKAAGRCPAGICNRGLQGWKADESKSRLEEGSEASIG